ncbi:MAG: FkbM family methyltransferase [Patescibacteria group bacterium]|nr:FkbM family methyltransferase [Patescibacteria group bacterium]
MEKLKSLVKKLPFIPTIYRNIRDNRWANREAVATPFGFKIIAGDAMQKGEFEQSDNKKFRAFVEDVDVVIDVGAHVGYYCLNALSLNKHLIAFEPMPLNTKVLLKNIYLNGWGNNAEVFQLALADKSGILEMYGGGTGASFIKGRAGFSSRTPTLVPVSSLDLVIGKRLAGLNVFILIDVEGAEYGVLNGAKELLKSDPKPIWMVEITTLTGNQPRERGINPNYLATFEIFWDAGYDAYCSDENMKLQLCDSKKIRETSEEAGKYFFSNFFFIHKSSDNAIKKLSGL